MTREQKLRDALSELWDRRAGQSNTVIIPDGADIYRVTTRAYAEQVHALILCSADASEWSREQGLDEYDDGEEFADMAMTVFGEDLLRKEAGSVR